LNTAAAASVAIATASGERSGTTAWAIATSAQQAPASSPVTIAYASVLEISRSISYSRYFRMPTPMLAGSATKPMLSTPFSHPQTPPCV
jgi:hypothetical protein